MTSKCGESSDDNNEQDDKLYNTENVLQAKTPLQSETVNEEGGRDTSETDTSLVPAVDRNLGGIENIFTENDAVGSSPSEENNVSSLSKSQSRAALNEPVAERT